MKPLLVGARDYYAACLFRLEETRGHLLNEKEYETLRQETLAELSATTRKPVFAICAVSIALLASSAGVLSLISGHGHPAVLLGISIATMISALTAATLLRKAAQEKATTDRLEMLDSLREHRLVTDVEFSQLRERLKAA